MTGIFTKIQCDWYPYKKRKVGLRDRQAVEYLVKTGGIQP